MVCTGTSDKLLRTAGQRHCGLLTNYGLEDLLRIDDQHLRTHEWCELRTMDGALFAVRSSLSPNPQLVSQFVVSQQSAMPLVRNS